MRGLCNQLSKIRCPPLIHLNCDQKGLNSCLSRQTHFGRRASRGTTLGRFLDDRIMIPPKFSHVVLGNQIKLIDQ